MKKLNTIIDIGKCIFWTLAWIPLVPIVESKLFLGKLFVK